MMMTSRTATTTTTTAAKVLWWLHHLLLPLPSRCAFHLLSLSLSVHPLKYTYRQEREAAGSEMDLFKYPDRCGYHNARWLQLFSVYGMNVPSYWPQLAEAVKDEDVSAFEALLADPQVKLDDWGCTYYDHYDHPVTVWGLLRHAFPACL
jgi:hypothetical protein